MAKLGNTTVDELLVKEKFSLENAVQKDMVFPAEPGKQGNNDLPAYDYTELGLTFPQNVAHIAHMGREFDHDYKAGSPVQIHLHMRQVEDLQATFRASYRWTQGGEAFGAWTEIDLDTYVFPFVANGHQILYGLDIDGAGKSESSYFEMKVWRTDTVHTSEVLVKEFSVHYYAEKVGKNIM